MIKIVSALAELGYREMTITPDTFAIKDIERGVVARFRDWQIEWEDLTEEEIIYCIEEELEERYKTRSAKRKEIRKKIKY